MTVESEKSPPQTKRDLPMRWRVEAALVKVPLVSTAVKVLQGQRKKVLGILERKRRAKSPKNLGNFAEGHNSQNGEDGIIAEIFRRIGTTNRFFVEFGVQDGTQCCTRTLLDAGWSGVWLEAVEDWAASAKAEFSGRGVNVVQAYLTRENIVQHFKDAGVVDEPDLISIDTDGCDYWLWEAIGSSFRPRVVITEYNASAGPSLDWAMPYSAEHHYDTTVYFGASLKAFAKLGDRLGYELVGCDPAGINAFFVRKDLVNDSFERVADPMEHFVAPHYGGWYGHSAVAGK